MSYGPARYDGIVQIARRARRAASTRVAKASQRRAVTQEARP